MAWYCERCKRYVDGGEVGVGELGNRHGRHIVTTYHRQCLQPVRAEKEAPPPAAARAGQEGEGQQ